MKKIIFAFFLIFPFLVFAQTFPFEVDYPKLGPISLPSLPAVVEEPGYYIRYIYQVGLIAGIILALFSLTIGGFLFLFSAGNVGKQMEAKDRIFSAIVGLLLLLASFVILRTFRPEFTTIQFKRPKFPFVEIEEGVWLCRNEIKENYRMGNNDYVLTFEVYIQSRSAIKNFWSSLDLAEQKAIHNLYYKVHNNCHLIVTSEDLPEDFRRAQHIYIIGNYGIILHRLPNFKGPFTLVTIKEKLYNFDTFNPPLQEKIGNFFYQKLKDEEIPNFSVTLFKDFRLNYADFLLSQSRSYLFPFQPYMDEYASTATITFYTFRNFHEDLEDRFQDKNSLCPSFKKDSQTQPCFKSYEFKIKDFVSEPHEKSFTVKDDSGHPFTFSFWVATTSEYYIGTISDGQITNGVELDSCYSLKIEPPPEPKYQEKSWWIVIAKGFPPPGNIQPDPRLPFGLWALAHPFLWGEAFDKSDRNLEDNYVSYFCEEKARQKRYPCIGTAIVFPGKIIKEIEK